MNITKNSKNQELAAEFAEQVKSGKVFVFAIEPTKNPEYVSVYVAQGKTTSNTATKAQQIALGWGINITRYIWNFKKELLATMPFNKVGGIVEDMAIQITESFNPIDEYNKPLTNPTDGSEVLIGGKPVYRTTELVDSSECNDTILDRNTVQQVASLQPNKANAEKTFA